MSDPFATAETNTEARVSISESARRRLAHLFAEEDTPNVMLRVTVSGGGCAGYQYGFDFETAVNDDDRVFGDDAVKIVVDNVSLGLLAGSELDFVEDMIGASFQVRNPNATTSCGCGPSFST